MLGVEYCTPGSLEARLGEQAEESERRERSMQGEEREAGKSSAGLVGSRQPEEMLHRVIKKNLAFLYT